jgi:hypothetical protein
MKTHKEIDLVYHEDEGNEAFVGTHQECLDWMSEQGFGYRVAPMTKEEMGIENKDLLEQAFTDGRLYEADELELDTEGRETAFEVWYEQKFPKKL